MNSDQISHTHVNPLGYGDSRTDVAACAFWLQQIAYQLAVLNERQASIVEGKAGVNVILCASNDSIPVALKET